MIKIVKVTGVETLSGYRLRVSSSDGSSGIHDFAGIVSESGPMVAPLRNPDVFKQVFISLGVLAWPNGYDLDAIQLHREMTAALELTADAAE